MTQIILQLNNLIKAAEEISSNPQIGLVPEIKKPVQKVTADDGSVYQLQLIITSLPEHIIEEE